MAARALLVLLTLGTPAPRSALTLQTEGSHNSKPSKTRPDHKPNLKSTFLVVLNGYPGGHAVLAKQADMVLNQSAAKHAAVLLTSHEDAVLGNASHLMVKAIKPQMFCAQPAVGNHKFNCNRAEADNKFLGAAFLANTTRHGFRWLLLGDDDTSFFLEDVGKALAGYNPDDAYFLGVDVQRRGKSLKMPAGYEHALARCPSLGKGSAPRFWSFNTTHDITDVKKDCNATPLRDDSWFEWAKGGNGMILSQGLLDSIPTEQWQKCVDRISTFGGDVRIAMCLALLGHRVRELPSEGLTLSKHKMLKPEKKSSKEKSKEPTAFLSVVADTQAASRPAGRVAAKHEAKPAAKHGSKPVAKPAAELNGKHSAKPAAKPSATSVVKLATQHRQESHSAKPAAKPSATSVIKLAAQHRQALKLVTKPAAKTAAKPAAKPAAKLASGHSQQVGHSQAAKPALKAAAKAATKAAAKLAAERSHRAEHSQAAKPAVKPALKAATKAAAKLAAEHSHQAEHSQTAKPAAKPILKAAAKPVAKLAAEHSHHAEHSQNHAVHEAGAVQKRAGVRSAMVKRLQEDKLFNPVSLHTGRAKTVSEDCKSWKGEGMHCETEFPEHALVRDWIPANATVMEFGARFGTTSCEIARKLNNSGNLVAVDPDLHVWPFLEENLKSHNCNARVLRGAVSSVDLHMAAKLNVKRGYSSRALDRGGVVVPGFSLEEVEAAMGKKVDTLLIDCEGCAQDMMDQLSLPITSGQIKLVIVEGDMAVGARDCHSHCMDYEHFFQFLEKHGFEMVDKFNDCDRNRTGAPEGKWCGKWIDHYAFRLREGVGVKPVSLASRLKDRLLLHTSVGGNQTHHSKTEVHKLHTKADGNHTRHSKREAANIVDQYAEEFVNQAGERNSDAIVRKLRQDELFNPATRHSGKARTVTEDCSGWMGEGLHCETEYPEHALVRAWIPQDATVMEFGARFGTTSCEIARKLNNSGSLVVVEPDLNVWEDLEGNLKAHGCNAHVLRGAVSAVDLHMAPRLNVRRGYSNRALETGGIVVPGFRYHEVEAALGKKVDTLLIDCEGCAQDMMDQLKAPIEGGQIKLLIIEGDMAKGAKDCHSHCMDYDKFFDYLVSQGFAMVDKFNDCDRKRTGAPEGKWCGTWIDHYAFRRQ